MYSSKVKRMIMFQSWHVWVLIAVTVCLYLVCVTLNPNRQSMGSWTSAKLLFASDQKLSYVHRSMVGRTLALRSHCQMFYHCFNLSGLLAALCIITQSKKYFFNLLLELYVVSKHGWNLNRCKGKRLCNHYLSTSPNANIPTPVFTRYRIFVTNRLFTYNHRLLT